MPTKPTPATCLGDLATGSRVALVRLRSMGDCVLTTPAIRILKEFRPDLEIGVVVDDRFRDVYTGNPDITTLFTPKRGALAGWGAALTVNLHGGTRSAWITALSLARWRAGFGHFRFQALYNCRLPRAQEVFGEERTVHTAEHVASAFFHLGLPITAIPAARLVAPQVARPSAYCVLHPQATAAEKIWPPDKFVALAEALESEHRLEPVFIGANEQELAPFGRFTTGAGTALKGVMSLIAGATMFVGNDSGPAHVAAAFGRPGVVLFGGSDPVVWAPWRCPQLCQIVHSPVAEITVETVLASLPASKAASAEHPA